MRDDDGWPVMRGERRIRFICGAIAGVFAGLQVASRIGVGKAGAALLIAVAVVAFGFAASLLGDRFWKGLGWW
jgi:hypothetical protein